MFEREFGSRTRIYSFLALQLAGIAHSANFGILRQEILPVVNLTNSLRAWSNKITMLETNGPLILCTTK